MQVEVKKEFQELIPKYLELLEQDILLIEKLIQHSDFENLALEFHKLKGHGEMYGFEYISNLSSAMEHFSKTEKLNLIEKTFAQLKKVVQDLEIVFVE